MLPSAKIITLLNSLIKDFGLTQVRHSKGASLSGGERRRVEIARALDLEPKFVLLDEPFAGVDPLAVNDIQNIIGDENVVFFPSTYKRLTISTKIKVELILLS